MLENWGLMTKAQDDSTTIDQAIAAAILAHETDPESHMGVDESIENHRINETVDHPAGSVLADKWTMSQFDFTTTFDNLDTFFMQGTYENFWPGVLLSTDGTGTVKKSSIIADLESSGFDFDTSKDMLFQFIFNADGDSDSLLAHFLGVSYADQYMRGMGLECIGETARFYTAKADGTSPNYLSFPTFAFGVPYIIRMHNDPIDGVVKVYINGELLGTLAWPEQWSGGLCYKTYLYDTTGYGNAVRVHSLYVSIQP